MSVEDFLKAQEQEAKKLPEHQREERLGRIKAMWESYRGQDQIITSHELAEMMDAEEPAHKVMSGQFSNLDTLVDGFRYEQLVVITAQEKSGKTAFVLQLIEQMKPEEPCCFLFEQSPRELIRQMQEKQQEIPYFLTPMTNVDNRLSWIEERALEAMVKRGTRIIVIDNMDWILKEYGYNQRTDEVVKDILLKLKDFCKTWGVIIFLVAHAKKMKMELIPQPDDIKDSSAFKQIADIVLILWRKTVSDKVDGTKTLAPKRTNQTLLWVAENRRSGKTGYVQLTYDKNRFIQNTWDTSLAAEAEFDSYESEF